MNGGAIKTKSFLTTAEISEYLRLPEETICNYARSGSIPAYKVGRCWRFDVLEAERWVENQRNVVTETPDILILDDEVFMQALMGRWLGSFGCKVDIAAGGMQALSMLHAHPYDLLFININMVELSDATMDQIIHFPQTPDIILMATSFDDPIVHQALAQGPITLIKKPVTEDTLVSLVKSFSVKTKRLSAVEIEEKRAL